MGEIRIKNKIIIFDDEDAALVASHKWYLVKNKYASTFVKWPDGRPRLVGMHRMICGDPSTDAVDHINRNTLDNRRCNLRPCSWSVNNRNRPTVSGKSSAFRGVSRTRRGKWQVVVRINGKLKYLGAFEDEVRRAKLPRRIFQT